MTKFIPSSFRYKLPLVLTLLVGVVISMKTLREPDLWWQLRTGEYIIEHGDIPEVDVFSYTFAGEPWVNVKWGFEVLLALLAKLGGPELVYLLQVLATLLILFSVHKIYRIISSAKDPPKLFEVAGLLLLLLTVTYRLNGRPEMVSHVFTCIYICLFLLHRRQKSKWLFAIVPLQILWANMHEGYGIGFVLLVMFAISEAIELFLFKIGDWERKVIIPLVTAFFAYAVVVVHPSGTIMYTQFLEIFNQLGANKYTIELYNFLQPQYWTYQSYINILLLIIGLIHFVSLIVKQGLKTFINRIGLFYVLVFSAFFYLSLSAQRNIPFFVFVAIPVVIDFFQSRLSANKFITGKAATYLAILLPVVVYISIVNDSFYKHFTPKDHFGLGVNMEKTPEGAARFVEQHNIIGNAYADYLSSSYLLWRLQPEFKTYIDLRDLDVFNAKFFDNVFMSYVNPSALLVGGKTLWQYLDSLDNFQYVALLNNYQFQSLHRYLLFEDPNFELVYADPLISLYLKQTPQHKSIIEQYGFNNGSKNVFYNYPEYDISPLANLLNNLANPLYEPPDYNDFDYNAMAKNYYGLIGVELE